MKISNYMTLAALLFYLNQIKAIPISGQHSSTVAGMDTPVAEEVGQAGKEAATTLSSIFVETFVDAAKGTAQGAAKGATYDELLQQQQQQQQQQRQ
ncbi:hypothetical protein BJ944DRAFT_269968 [Cunninghamella echinulata]|nr:hypothetical protein BJ944DRAFT_269968 [Cunninghamella echinulata]